MKAELKGFRTLEREAVGDGDIASELISSCLMNCKTSVQIISPVSLKVTAEQAHKTVIRFGLEQDPK